MSQVNGFDPIFDTVNAKKGIANGLGATQTLSVDQSGETIVMDRAAGIVITLPLAVPGLYYDFDVTTSVTSNSYKIITGAATEFLVGGATNVDTDTSNAVAFFSGNGSTHRAVTMNGTTTGGLIGTSIRFTCLSATRWMVTGQIFGSGTVATPFATS